MGIDFTALMDHSLPWDQMITLDRIIDKEWQKQDSPLRLPFDRIRSDGRWRWELDSKFNSVDEELFERGHVYFESPVGFLGDLFRKGMSIYHTSRWWSFLCEDTVQSALRNAVHHIAQIVGAKTVIYLPDSNYHCSIASDLLYDDKEINDVLLWLKQQCGPPAETIRDIYSETENTWDGDGYYVEAVANL